MRKISKIPQCISHYQVPILNLLLVTVAFLGTILIFLLYTGSGVYVTHDSISYIAMARSLLEGEGLLNWAGKPEASWPPGYPILLSITGFFSDPLHTAGALNSVAMGLTIFFVGFWLMQRIKSRFLVFWTCLLLAFAFPLRLAAYSVWSETVFILFVMLSIIWMDKYLMTQKRSSLIMVAVFTAFACLTRYVGITLIITVLPLLALQRGVKFREKAQRIGLYLVISLTPLCVWLLRNTLNTDTLTGRRFPSEISLSDNIELTLNILMQWWQPLYQFKIVFQTVSVPITVGVLIALFILVSYTFILWWKNPDKLRDKNFILIAGIFGFVYLSFMVWSTATVKVLQPLSHRYLSPAYIPLLILIVFILDQFVIYCRKTNHVQSLITARGIMYTLPALIFFLLSLWAGCAGYAALQYNKARIAGGGLGYRSKVWLESETLKRLQEYSPVWIYSNAPYVIYINNAHAPASSPTYRYLPPETNSLIEQIDNIYTKQESVYIVWFHVHSENKRYDYDASYLIGLQGLEPLAEYADGVILKASPELGNR